MTRRLNLILALLLVLVGGPVWYLFLDTSPWSVSPENLQLDKARKLAVSSPGAMPERVEYEVVTQRSVPGNLFAAGSGFKTRKMGVLAFRLIVSGKPAILIETGITPEYTKELRFGAFDRAAQDRVDQAMRDAGLILVTHEHGDHLGGFADLLRRENASAPIAKARLNASQVPSGKSDAAMPWPAGLKIKASIESSSPQLIAPGVVAIPTPGHTPGSQMIYVQLADGTEFLFAGDTAPMAASWDEIRPPSRLITDYWTPEDRRKLVGWLKALEQAKRTSRALNIIPGHDLEWLSDPLNRVPIRRIPQVRTQNQAGN